MREDHPSEFDIHDQESEISKYNDFVLGNLFDMPKRIIIEQFIDLELGLALLLLRHT